MSRPAATGANAMRMGNERRWAPYVAPPPRQSQVRPQPPRPRPTSVIPTLPLALLTKFRAPISPPVPDVPLLPVIVPNVAMAGPDSSPPSSPAIPPALLRRFGIAVQPAVRSTALGGGKEATKKKRARKIRNRARRTHGALSPSLTTPTPLDDATALPPPRPSPTSPLHPSPPRPPSPAAPASAHLPLTNEDAPQPVKRNSRPTPSILDLLNKDDMPTAEGILAGFDEVDEKMREREQSKREHAEGKWTKYSLADEDDERDCGEEGTGHSSGEGREDTLGGFPGHILANEVRVRRFAELADEVERGDETNASEGIEARIREQFPRAPLANGIPPSFAHLNETVDWQRAVDVGMYLWWIQCVPPSGWTPFSRDPVSRRFLDNGPTSKLVREGAMWIRAKVWELHKIDVPMGVMDSFDPCIGALLRATYEREYGCPPPTRQFPSEAMCEKYTSTMARITVSWIRAHRRGDSRVDIRSIMASGKIANVTLGTVNYGSPSPIKHFHLCHFDTFPIRLIPRFTSKPLVLSLSSTITSTPTYSTVHPTRPSRLRNPTWRGVALAEFAARFAGMVTTTHRKDPRYSSQLLLPPMSLIKDAYEHIQRSGCAGDIHDWNVTLQKLHLSPKADTAEFWRRLQKGKEATKKKEGIKTWIPPPPSNAVKKRLRLLERSVKKLGGAVTESSESPFDYGYSMIQRLNALIDQEDARLAKGGHPYSAAEIKQLDPRLFDHGVRSKDRAMWLAGGRRAGKDTLLERLRKRLFDLAHEVCGRRRRARRRIIPKQRASSERRRIETAKFATKTCRLSSPPQLSASRRNHLKTRTDPELAKILRSRISEMYKPMVPRLRVLHKTNSVPDSLVRGYEKFVTWEGWPDQIRTRWQQHTSWSALARPHLFDFIVAIEGGSCRLVSRTTPLDQPRLYRKPKRRIIPQSFDDWLDADYSEVTPMDVPTLIRRNERRKTRKERTAERRTYLNSSDVSDEEGDEGDGEKDREQHVEGGKRRKRIRSEEVLESGEPSKRIKDQGRGFGERRDGKRGRGDDDGAAGGEKKRKVCKSDTASEPVTRV